MKYEHVAELRDMYLYQVIQVREQVAFNLILQVMR